MASLDTKLSTNWLPNPCFYNCCTLLHMLYIVRKKFNLLKIVHFIQAYIYLNVMLDETVYLLNLLSNMYLIAFPPFYNRNLYKILICENI
jgi:hypothetical protein